MKETIELSFSVEECKAIMFLLDEKLRLRQEVPFEVNVFGMYDYIADELPFQLKIKEGMNKPQNTQKEDGA